MGERAGPGRRMDRTGAMGRGRQVRDLIGRLGRNRHDARRDRKDRRRRGRLTNRDSYGIRLASRSVVGSVRKDSRLGLVTLVDRRASRRPNYFSLKNSVAIRITSSGCSIGKKWVAPATVTTLPFSCCAAILSGIALPGESLFSPNITSSGERLLRISGNPAYSRERA